MLDTSTVNYAIDRVALAWQQILPQIQNVSEKFVEFTVAKTLLTFSACSLIMIVGIYILALGINGGNKASWGTSSPWIVFFVVGTAVSLSGIVCFFVSGYQSILAICYPEMYTIQQIINAAK